MGVDDQNTDPFFGPGKNVVAQFFCGVIRVRGQEQDPLLEPIPRTCNVGMVDAGIGAHKTELVLHDNGPGADAQDFIALTQDELNQTRILAGLFRQFNCAERGLDRDQVHSPAFRFGDYLLCNDKDIPFFENQAICFNRLKNEFRQIVTLADEGDMVQRSEGQGHGLSSVHSQKPVNSCWFPRTVFYFRHP